MNFLSRLILCAACLTPFMAQAADSGCTLIISYPSGNVLHQDGDCQQRRSPFSTFKVPLAVMGFDSGVLKDPVTPTLDYDKDDETISDREKVVTNPTIWLKDSIVWYSQYIARQIGMEKFQAYVQQFKYGNRNVKGDPGQDNGLTRSWLGSSVEISPEEQVTFIQKFLNRDLGVSERAYDMTLASMPKFTTEAWTVYGKTGSGWLRARNKSMDQTKPQGWFVGWAQKGNTMIVFAKLYLPGRAIDGYAGLKTREIFLQSLPGLMAPIGH